MNKIAIGAITGVAAVALAVGGCGNSTHSASPTPARMVTRTTGPAPPQTKIPAPVPSTVTTTAPPAPAPATTVTQPAPAPPAPQVTDPWAVVSAYYGDVESGAYANAYALLSSGLTTGQSYQQFVNGYACTGDETVSENWESGDQVNFDLSAYDNCTGKRQTYTGTDTVQDGLIAGASITQTS